jgi:hypothetical protein
MSIIIAPSDNGSFEIFKDKEYQNFDLQLTDDIITEIENKRYDDIILRWYGNFPLDNLPECVVKLELYESDFNLQLDNLPLGLKELILHCFTFNQPIDNLPVGLELLKIGCSVFNQPIDNLPINLKVLHIYSDWYEYNLFNLPNSLKILSLDFQTIKDFKIIWPPMLEIVYLNTNINLDDLPDSIKTMYIYINTNHTFSKLPENLERIVFGGYYKQNNKKQYQRIVDIIKKDFTREINIENTGKIG